MDARVEPIETDAVEREQPAWYRRHPALAALAALVLAVVIAGGVWWWISSQNYATTTDARVAGNVTQMSAMVPGRVTTLLFADNQHVNAGQKLVLIDPRDLQAKLDQAVAQQTSAAAQVAQANAQIAARQADLAQAVANTAVAQANLTEAQKDNERYQHLSPAAVTQQQRDQASATFRSATAKLNAAHQAEDSAKAQVDVAKAQLTAAEAGVKQAEASVEAARLQLSYATITAPVGGRIANRTVNVGDVVQQGQPMFAIVQDGLWIEADFKETQLAGMKPGQRVTVSVDAVPGVTFHGKVDSFQSGTGAEFSALPAENATGNWVKIVQRIPVKIVLTGKESQQYFLAPGMSAEPSVKLH